ncbi:MAG: response regulator [Brevinematales bacterium]|nr:response regulator [Brevinematales bacterium]
MESKNKKILIVEDEAIITWNIARIIERYHYEICATTRTFEEGLQAFQTHRPDVIIMDIVLAGEKNGLDLAEEILKQEYVPIICLTAYSTGSYITKIQSLNIFGYLVKPFEERELGVMLHLAMNESHRAKVLDLDRKQKEDTIHQLGKYFQSLADSLPFLLIDFRNNGTLFYANAMAKKTFGIHEEEKLSFADLFPHDRNLQLYYTKALEGTPQIYRVLPCKNANEKTCWHLSFWFPVSLPTPGGEQGVRFLSISLQEWLDHLLLPRERLWEHYRLTAREIDILRGILQGKRIHTIAKENFISLPTVKYHINQLYTKMGVKDREELYQVLQEKILTDMPPDVFFAYLFTSLVPFIKK